MVVSYIASGASEVGKFSVAVPPDAVTEVPVIVNLPAATSVSTNSAPESNPVTLAVSETSVLDPITQVTNTLVTSEPDDETVPDAFDTVQTCPVGCVVTVTS